jgi:CxC2 like cysteine cluster associated with KDZ transposases
MERHKLLPFHRIQKWNSKYFAKTTLFQQGYILHLGHRGLICPSNLDANDEWRDVDEGPVGVDGINLLNEEIQEQSWKTLEEGVVDIVHTTGVFRNNVRWCTCQDASDKATQLFQMELFPASHHRPETAFTFDGLDYFYIDAMECKTPAASFMRKVCRLTNNAFPHMVVVSFNGD